ncbi:bifunctional DNA-formamidopyrimidine glycosylase/DNA-(apurinic or apyrimidinic site) lyase [Falsigemmobacter intermedius]|uniref:bifunctional DNA-formamidopyrimidine glycosylase/DNA-(apurinic or apyrimidinic site) lyase n=1 Tax=Falsigemmobacter intermedius TaxID=1553448 RepID=UPI003F01C3F8
MPELPEVETVRRGLLPLMEGQIITRAEVRRPDLRWPLPENMAGRLTGVRIDRMRRRSKYILADLSSGETLLIHLGMSGRMLITPPGEARQDTAEYLHVHAAPGKHDHILLEMENGAVVAFNDPRRFGMWDLLPTEGAEAHPLLAVIGPEPFGNDFSESWLIERFRGRKTPVKAALLDQGNVAGLGNIYVCEVLYRAGISPLRQAGDLSERDVAGLVPLIREVLAEAIEAGGSSLKDYRQADGELGYFQHSFRVYGREGGDCVTPGCAGVIRRDVQSGRSSFWCPQCQPLPGPAEKAPALEAQVKKARVNSARPPRKA